MKDMSVLLLLPILVVSLLSAPRSTDAWGKEGHFMVCKIAADYLTERTTAAVLDLLPDVANGELASVCSWPDEVRFRYRWSSPLHYINTPGVCNYAYTRQRYDIVSLTNGIYNNALFCITSDTFNSNPSIDIVLCHLADINFILAGDCHDSNGIQGRCVVGAINNYTKQLYNYGDSKNTYNLTESLMFLSHFVGDVHQPLHVGFEADEGGNTIIVHWYRRKTNLHHVWDVSIIETAMKDFYDNDRSTMIDAIRLNITEGWSDEVNKWEACQNKRDTCANDYASESIQLACSYAYKDVEQDSTLQDDYFYSRYPVVEKQIAKAGVRLAIILNHIFDAGTSYTMNSVPLHQE